MGSPTYLHNDHLGSPVAATDGSGAVLWREEYAPFGDELLNPAANDDNQGYTSHVEDGEAAERMNGLTATAVAFSGVI